MHHVLIPTYWNLSSVLLEVALCIALYIFVLFFEFFPAFLEAGGGPQGSRGYNKIMFVLVAIGVLLPTMHQSSLGSLMIISGNKLSPLWQSGLLPFYNVTTAILMGYAITVFESYFSALAFGRPFETAMLKKVSGVIPGLLIVYLVVRWADLLFSGALGRAFSGVAGLSFWIENILLVSPLFVLLPAAKRESGKNLCLGAFLLLLGGAVLKFNLYIVGFQPAPGWRYFPSVPEIMITLAIVSVEIMAYLIFVKKLPVLPEAEHV
jgi:Ni/Fe-hydrogenase subunit HybB-like protein